jgi:hypothetical protein
MKNLRSCDAFGVWVPHSLVDGCKIAGRKFNPWRKTNMTNPASPHDASDQFVLTELEILRSGEERLQRLFPNLGLHPQFQTFFLQELAEIRERADRLDGILNCSNTFSAAPSQLQPIARRVKR